MAPTIPPIEEVESALKAIHSLLENPITVIPRKENKVFQIRHNLKIEDVKDMIQCLSVRDFAKVDQDRTPGYSGDFWFFYKCYDLSDRPVWVYIKMKIQERLLVVSFHDAEYELLRPYSDVKCGDS